MDSLIKRYDAVQDKDLMLCEHHGVAYQRDMKADRVSYDDFYLVKVAAYDNSEIAKAVNAGRCALVERHLPIKLSAARWSEVLDVGAGTGAFVRALLEKGYQGVKGFEVMPSAARELKLASAFSTDICAFDAVTFWDSLEHLEMPEISLRSVRKGALLFASVPIFEDLKRIRESKHYRPGEHLYYWTEKGFIEWMALYGFRHLESSAHEVKAGRESIGAFAFRKDLPDYNDHVLAYREMHSKTFYGNSATELYFESIANIVKQLAPKSILDFGCGRSDLVAHFWKDGERTLARYDPAIGAYKILPGGEFDLVLCCDVMEHIPMGSVDRIFREVRSKSKRAVFTISTKPARAKLPDGRNAHVTLLTRDEWIRWVKEYFGSAQVLPTKWETELMVVAGAEVKQPAMVVAAIRDPDPEPRCKCGGEMVLDSFRSMVNKDSKQEWFMRCRDCGEMSSPADREEDARTRWREQAAQPRVAA